MLLLLFVLGLGGAVIFLSGVGAAAVLLAACLGGVSNFDEFLFAFDFVGVWSFLVGLPLLLFLPEFPCCKMSKMEQANSANRRVA